MLPAIPLFVAGAGLYLGSRWLAKELLRKADDVRKAADEVRARSSELHSAPRDLGPLVFDKTSGTYVPRDKH